MNRQTDGHVLSDDTVHFYQVYENILNGLKSYRANTVSIPIIIKGHISVKLQVEYSIDAFHFDLVS